MRLCPKLVLAHKYGLVDMSDTIAQKLKDIFEVIQIIVAAADYMKIRTIYFKVTDMPKAVAFWQAFLGSEPHKKFDSWHEFMAGNVRLGLLLNDFGDKYTGSNCVPVFEFGDDEVLEYVERAKKLGATVIKEGLDDPNLKSVVFADSFGNEFEVSKFHD